VLPAEHRITRAEEIRDCVRRGVRASTDLMTVHLTLGDPADPPRAAFVVGRRVGGSVTRHRVQRRLRHQFAPRLGGLPAGARVVVRASPAAATATSPQLADDLDRALGRAAQKVAGHR